MRVRLPESIRRFPVLIIACVLYAVTGCSQTPGSKTSQQTIPASGEKAKIAIESALPCPPAGSHRAPSVRGHHKVTLTWKASRGNNVVGYCLYRSPNEGVAKNKSNTPFSCAGCEQINSVPVVATGCVDDHVPDGSTYFYVATAFDGHQGLSPASNEVRADIREPFSSLPQASRYDLCRESGTPHSK